MPPQSSGCLLESFDGMSGVGKKKIRCRKHATSKDIAGRLEADILLSLNF
ncbi:unnamed protein product [Camellia sinensis]